MRNSIFALALLCIWAGKSNAQIFPSLPSLLPGSCKSTAWTSQYDMDFYLAAQRFLTPERRNLWCVLKAQAIAESDLRPDAVSPAGAVGLTQFLKGTFEECVSNVRLAPGSTRTDPNAAIHCQAWYMNRLMDIWFAPRTQGCRVRLAAASYNAGAGNVIQAQKFSGGASCWGEIRKFMTFVTGHHAEETINYVDRIDRTHTRLSGFPLGGE